MIKRETDSVHIWLALSISHTLGIITPENVATTTTKSFYVLYSKTVHESKKLLKIWSFFVGASTLVTDYYCIAFTLY